MNEQIEEMVKYVPRNITAYDGNPRGLQLYIEQRINIAEALYNAGYRRQDEVAFEVIDKFRDDLISIFIDMCRGNDYNKINLLQIGDAIDAFYDSYIAELKKKYGVKEE